jgi:DNA-binding Lrp family transcriptional regulator
MYVAGARTPIDDHVRIISLHLKLWNLNEIAREIGYDRATIEGVLAMHNYHTLASDELGLAKRVDFYKKYKENIIHYYNNGNSLKNTSLKFKINILFLSDRLKKDGVLLKKELNDVDIKNIIRFYLIEKKTQEQIGAIYGYAGTAIRSILLRNNIQLRKKWETKRKRIFTEDKKREILKRYLSGETIKSISLSERAQIHIISGLIREMGYAIIKCKSDKFGLEKEPLVVQDYIVGMTIEKLSLKYGFNFRRIKKILKKFKIKERTASESSRYKFTKEQILFYTHQYEIELMSLEAIAAQIPCFYGTLKKALIENGVHIFDRKQKRAILSEDESLLSIDLYNKNIPFKDIAEKIGKTASVVRRALVDKGIKIKNHLNFGSKRFGYAGYYKNYLFRSLMELSFIIDNEKLHKIESAEDSHMIKYRFDNKIRKYYPDFIIDDKKIVEIKPKQQMSDRKVRRKIKKIKEYCFKNGIEFEILEWPMDKNKLRNLFLSGAFRIVNKPIEKIEKYLAIKPAHYCYEI